MSTSNTSSFPKNNNSGKSANKLPETIDLKNSYKERLRKYDDYKKVLEDIEKTEQFTEDEKLIVTLECLHAISPIYIEDDVRSIKIIKASSKLAFFYQNKHPKKAKEILEEYIINKESFYERNNYYNNDYIICLIIEGLRHYSIILRNLGDIENAIIAFKHYITKTNALNEKLKEGQKENIVQSIYSLSLCYYNLKKFDFAKEYIDELINKYKDYNTSYLVDWYNLKGIICFKKKETDIAIYSYEQGKKIYETLEGNQRKQKKFKYFEIINNLAFLSAIKNSDYYDLQYAKKSMKEIPTEIKDTNENFLDTEGYISYKLGNYYQAIKFFDKALSLKNKTDSSRWQILIHKGNVCFEQKKYEEAT